MSGNYKCTKEKWKTYKGTIQKGIVRGNRTQNQFKIRCTYLQQQIRMGSATEAIYKYASFVRQYRFEDRPPV